MADFGTLESSVEESRPLEIYEVLLGGVPYRWTSAEDKVTVDGDDYQPEPGLSRSDIEQGTGQDRRTLKVTVSGRNTFAALYKNIVPGQRATLTIWRLQRDESPMFDTKQIIYQGQVMSVAFSQNGFTADLAVRSLEVALARNIPRYSHAGACQHVLYGTGCLVNPAGFNIVGTVSAVVSTVITLPGASAEADGYYINGYCTPLTGASDFRMIVDHVGDDLTLLLPFAVDVTGVSVQAFSGCDRLIEGDCALKFDNVPRHGGWAFVPDKNLFETGLE